MVAAGFRGRSNIIWFYAHDNKYRVLCLMLSCPFKMVRMREGYDALPQKYADNALTCAGIEDGNIGELVQLIELDVSLSLFTIVIYL